MDSTGKFKEQKELVEELGRYYDKEGLQPIVGRILGLLIVMDKEQFTFEEIVEELNISKSSASNALKNLEIRGDIEYLTLPGDRKRYFRFRRRNLLSIIETFQQKTASFKHITNHILELKEDKNSLNSRYLKQLMEMIDFFSAKLNDTKAEFTKMMEANSQENNQK
ncbi:hypothetical protein MASR2M47_00090 [Draconibacterium sp.]|jgi:DNA-binding transcriptional regulator GbsR (MarR family)